MSLSLSVWVPKAAKVEPTLCGIAISWRGEGNQNNSKRNETGSKSEQDEKAKLVPKATKREPNMSHKSFKMAPK
jgi:hypothetical protein